MFISICIRVLCFSLFPLAVLSCMLTSIRTALFVWANRLKWVNFALFSDLFLARHSLVTANDGLLSLQISCTWVITKHMYHHGLPSFNCVCVIFGAIDTTWIFLSILHSLVFCNWLVKPLSQSVNSYESHCMWLRPLSLSLNFYKSDGVFASVSIIYFPSTLSNATNASLHMWYTLLIRWTLFLNCI